MSHFTNLQTEFKNLDYLKKALNKLNIAYKEDLSTFQEPGKLIKNLNISQINGPDLVFLWKNDKYYLKFDQSFWKQSISVNMFLNKIGQKYAEEVIVKETKKYGYKLINYQNNKVGVSKIIVERWS